MFATSRFRQSLFALALAFSCAHVAAQPAEPALKDVFKHDFLVGAALAPQQFAGPADGNCEVALIQKQFNTITPENVLKWGLVHPWPGRYDFSLSDKYVDFGVKNKMFVVGHNLVWHDQTPDWVFHDSLWGNITRDALIERMRDHIFTVVGRYKGKIRGWDVVNEAIDEDGKMRQSGWMRIIGEDYVLKAYQFAHEADPKLQLYYNDFNTENPAKRAGAIALVKKLLTNGIPVAAVGIQGHYNLDYPPLSALEAAINDFSALGVKVMITELDVNVLPSPNDLRNNPYPDGLPDAMQERLAKRYADLFKVFVKHKKQITRVTFWGVTDGDSWLNYLPMRRTDYPLLFARGCAPKPAFYAVIGTAAKPSKHLPSP